jgi:Rps23 Pro-64 3,4-dihydroxylase Tpa1-like proline 4-hydroxylase
MSAPILPIDAETLSLDTTVAKEIGKRLGVEYQARQPFPYGGFDNFLPDTILDRVLQELSELPEAEATFNRPQEKLKQSFVPERLPVYTKSLFYALNSRPVILFLEELTGIEGLIPDPYFTGGGIHVTANGGHLDIHADFNYHSQLKLERRVNILIYLNKDWQEEYGGSFEVWNKGMTAKVAGYVPTFNRMCCFNTSSESWHGNPEPVNHPDGKPRMSIALYYYTATWSDLKRKHTTLFQPRPGTHDQADRLIARREWLQDVLPPFIHRRVAGKMRRIGF